ncbi:MAG: hypothetical protein IJF37_08485 [Lachnospiraceae bacterium]|nr:hypothetical protein [Lachnospiraceae bacterium]
MKKILFITIATCFIVTGCSCSNEPDIDDNTIAQSSTSTSDITEANGTETETETSTLLPEGMAYQLEDGSYIEIDQLLAPMNSLNSICQGLSNSDSWLSVYPVGVTEKLAEYNEFESIEEYADFLHTAYVQMYGENYTLSNEYKSCSLLDEEQLSDMSEFYSDHFYVDILPEYAFIVESQFCVTYTDEEGEEQQDCTSDYYIAYYLDGSMYLDYFYVDSIDL